MIIARQSTARTVMVGPVLDADGVAVTDSVVGDFKISKNGGAPAALNGSATLTHRHTGYYSLALTTSDLDTVGQAEVTCDDTVNACPIKEITVIEEAVYDISFAASATGAVPVASIANNAITASAIASGAITDAKIASDAFTAAKFASDVTTELQSGLATAAELAKVPKSDGTATWNATALAAMQQQAEDALAAHDAPTNTDLDARTLAAASYATASAQATAQADLDTLTGTDGVILATSQPNYAPATAAALTTVDGIVDTIVATTNKLDDTLEDQGGGTYGFTEAALQEAPTGSGGGGGDATEAKQDAIIALIGTPAVDLATDIASRASQSSVNTIDGIVDDILADTADMQPKLGAPAGASMSADIAAVKAQTAAIETDTQDIQSRIPAALVGGRIDATVDATGMEAGAVSAIQSGLATAADLATVDSNVDAVKAKTDSLTFTTAGMVDAAIKRVGDTTLAAAGTGGQGYGAAP